jgi:hypothetical protein
MKKFVPIAIEESVVTDRDLFKKRNRFFLYFLFLTIFTFTADVLDLRDEVEVLSSFTFTGSIFTCQYKYLDSNITAGLIQNFYVKKPNPILIKVFHTQGTSTTISCINSLSYSFRAPPAKS